MIQPTFVLRISGTAALAAWLAGAGLLSGCSKPEPILHVYNWDEIKATP